jgi:hypothetical protein
MNKEEQENLFLDILQNVALQEDRVGSILKKTLKIDINPDMLGIRTKNNFGFLDDNYGFEDEPIELSSKRKFSPSPQR